MSDSDGAAREALMARLGTGARYDASGAPHAELHLARRGTAYFARKLNELSDAELAAPSMLPERSRRNLVARLSHHARAYAISLKGLWQPLIAEEADWQPDLDLAVTLPARALRHLFEHSAKHLDVEWRDLPDACWDGRLIVPGGQAVTARETPRLRALAIWHAAVALGNGGRTGDIPEELQRPGRDARPVQTDGNGGS